MSVDNQVAVLQPQTSEINIDILPNETLTEIFRYIPQHELFFTVAQVSGRWRKLVLQLNEYFLDMIPKNSEELSTAKIRCLLDTVGCAVSEVHLYDRTDSDDILNEVSKRSKDVSILSLTRCRGKPKNDFIGAQVLKSVIIRLTNLTTIRLHATAFRSVKFFEMLGSEQFMREREKKARKRDVFLSEGAIEPITFMGSLSYNQVEAYTRNLIVNMDLSGHITLTNGRQFTVQELKEVLDKAKTAPYALIRLFES